MSRLWLRSLTPEAIRQGFERLRASSDFDPLADAARGRSRADWLVGMNLSRATTLAHDNAETLHVGRVQTPALALLVEREKAIRGFVPEDYLEVVATFGAGDSRYQGTWFRPPSANAARGAEFTSAERAGGLRGVRHSTPLLKDDATRLPSWTPGAGGAEIRIGRRAPMSSPWRCRKA